MSVPQVKHGVHFSLQVKTQPFHLVVMMIDKSLEVSDQMGPAPLQVSGSPVHLRPVTVDNSLE